MKRFLLFFALLLLPLCAARADTLSLDEMLAAEEAVMITDSTHPSAENPAREDFIDRIISTAKSLYDAAGGKAKRAQYSGDIYVCKNFTVHLFKENRDDFCIAEFPDVELRIPNNLPSDECKPYYYGLAWESIDAEDGNPFYEAASFRYDATLSKEENLELACEFMRQVQRGDYFQMSAKYEYGTGAHSAIMLGYDAATDEIHWMDSNMALSSLTR